MPRKKTARKQGEKFVSKVNDKMVAARLEELFEGRKTRGVMLPKRMLVVLLAYIRTVLELEEISRKIDDIRAKQGIQASLVSIGPRGGRTLTPLQRLRRVKMNQVLRKYQSLSQTTEWVTLSGIEGKKFLVEAMRYPCGSPDRVDKPAKKKAAKKPSPRRVSGRRPRRRESSEFIIVRRAEPSPLENAPPSDLFPTSRNTQKPEPITVQDIANTIKEAEKKLKREELPPEKRAAFQATLVELKSWKKDWKTILRIASNTKMLLDVIEQIAKLIEFLRSLF